MALGGLPTAGGRAARQLERLTTIGRSRWLARAGLACHSSAVNRTPEPACGFHLPSGRLGGGDWLFAGTGDNNKNKFERGIYA